MEPQLTGSLTLKDKQGVATEFAKQDLRDQMHSVIEKAALAHGIPLESLERIYVETLNNLFNGAELTQVNEALKISLRPYVEMDERFSYLIAAVLDHDNRREVCQLLGLPLDSTDAQILLPSLKHGVKVGRISEKVFEHFSEEDIQKLANYLQDHRSANFTYLGLQTLYDRYFLHDNEVRYETAQVFFMRVAIGHAFDEKRDEVNGLVYAGFNTPRLSILDAALATFDPVPETKLDNALNFIVDLYDAYSQFEYMSSTPTLFNSATIAPQMSSCYLSTIPDDLGGIYSALRDDALLSKFAGGLGNDWTPVRALNSYIKGTNGKSQGVVPFLKVANDTAVAVNQCFDPTTPLYTASGIKPIESINIGDLVLGKSGNYKPVLDVMSYDQKDDMRLIKVKHGFEPLKVTAGHPFLVLRGNPKGGRTNPDNFKLEWIEAKDLTTDDMIAQVIPKEFTESTLTVDDAFMYGILLGDGHCAKESNEWGITGDSSNAGHIAFATEYLKNLGIHTWTTGDSGRVQLRWAKNSDMFPFVYTDIYTIDGKKYIHPKYLNLNNTLALNIIKGLLLTDGNISRGKEITFSTTSVDLLHGLRYLLLKIETPSSVYTRTRTFNHVGLRNDDTTFVMNSTTTEHVLRIPASDKIALLVSVPSLTKRNWIVYNGYMFTRVKSNDKMAIPSVTVYDLIVEGDESYMTVNGLAHNGGKRKGAMCAYLETWHLDIEEFLELRKNTGDDRRRTHDMNTANWIPDLFMKRVILKEKWTLFTPSETPDLHDLVGKAFEERYTHYEAIAKETGMLHKVINAEDLWRKMLGMVFETGHPWLTWKDVCNIRSPQDHVGVVHSSNLCTEITLNTSADEIAVCNLGSINAVSHVREDGTIDEDKLARTVHLAVRALDNVIDANMYPVPQAQNANMRHRPVGLGLMGFQDALFKMGIDYASQQAVEFADKFQELLSYYAIAASAELAKIRGAYSTFKGSKWDRGIFPLDTLKLLEEERGAEYCQFDYSSHLGEEKWNELKGFVKQHGMRNSNVQAIAPTATISNIIGVSQSIEPVFQNVYVKSNLSGEFTIVNPYLQKELTKLGLWDNQIIQEIKNADGSVQEIDRIPLALRNRFCTAFEVGAKWLVEAAARRQKWIDQAQSLNLYIADANGRKLDMTYKMGWVKGLKTTYYLRALSATQTEKVTGASTLNAVKPVSTAEFSQAAPVPGACSIDNPDCEACQ